jgi:hypothetical protein
MYVQTDFVLMCCVGSGSNVAVALEMRSERNAPKNGEPTVRFSFVTVFQHTGRFWSKIFDVITSLVSLVYWGFRGEKVTSQGDE